MPSRESPDFLIIYLIVFCITYFSHCCDAIAGKFSLRKDEIILANILRNSSRQSHCCWNIRQLFTPCLGLRSKDRWVSDFHPTHSFSLSRNVDCGGRAYIGVGKKVSILREPF